MAMKKTLSRIEVNKTVKKILKVHNADQSQLTLSCSTRGVRISGHLIKENGKDFYAKGIENIIRDIAGVRGISMLTWDLENWHITGSNIQAVGDKQYEGKKGDKGDAQTAGSETKSSADEDQERYEIGLEILDDDIYKDTGS